MTDPTDPPGTAQAFAKLGRLVDADADNPALLAVVVQANAHGTSYAYPYLLNLRDNADVASYYSALGVVRRVLLDAAARLQTQRIEIERHAQVNVDD